MYTRRSFNVGLAAGGAAALALGVLPRPSFAALGPVIAAAANLRFALAELAEAFSRETGTPLRLSFASSGNLARQIRQGAPFELFLSADEDYALALTKDGLTAGAGTVYALGRLAVFAPHASTVGVDPVLSGVRAALRTGELKRFAIANPEHAPYGRAAREALIHAGLWDALAPRLVLGENVSQAAQFAATGSCEAALVALSLAVAPGFAEKGRFSALPTDWHRPLHQRMVLLASAGETARAFYAYLQGGAAREVFSRHGFGSPQDG